MDRINAWKAACIALLGAAVSSWLPEILAVGKDAVDAAGEHIDAVENTESKNEKGPGVQIGHRGLCA